MDKEALSNVIEALNELREDNTVPKNIKAKVESMIGFLQKASENSLNVDKAIHEIEEITEDANMQPYTRIQIFNVVSLLETVK